MLVLGFKNIHSRTLLLSYELAGHLRLPLLCCDLGIRRRLFIMSLLQVHQDIVHRLYLVSWFVHLQGLRALIPHLLLLYLMLLVLRFQSYLMRNSISSISRHTDCMLYFLRLTLKHSLEMPNFRHHILLINRIPPLLIPPQRRRSRRFRFLIIILESFIARGWSLDRSHYPISDLVLCEEEIRGEIDRV